MQHTNVNIAQLQVGQVVAYYGGLFQVTEPARDSQGHRPKGSNGETAHGPANCAVVKAVCIAGEVKGYFKQGTDWTFQGTVGGPFAVQHSVVQ